MSGNAFDNSIFAFQLNGYVDLFRAYCLPQPNFTRTDGSLSDFNFFL